MKNLQSPHIQLAIELLSDGLGTKRVASFTGIPRSTLIRLRRRLGISPNKQGAWNKGLIGAPREVPKIRAIRVTRAKTIPWYKRNPDAWKKQFKERDRRHAERKTNTFFASRLRSRLSVVLSRHNAKRTNDTFSLLGCSIEYFRAYLAGLFKPGMSWGNYGQWEIDHVRPCASFDLSLAEEQAKCFHYSNLQPLWMLENRKKSNQITL